MIRCLRSKKTGYFSTCMLHCIVLISVCMLIQNKGFVKAKSLATSTESNKSEHRE